MYILKGKKWEKSCPIKSQTNRERERLKEKEGNILVKREKKHSDRGRQTGRQIDRQMDRQTDRQAG